MIGRSVILFPQSLAVTLPTLVRRSRQNGLKMSYRTRTQSLTPFYRGSSIYPSHRKNATGKLVL